MTILKMNVIIPEWAQFLAQDEDGSWFAYEEKPFSIDMIKGEGIFDVKQGNFKQLTSGSHQEIDWSSTLFKLGGEKHKKMFGETLV